MGAGLAADQPQGVDRMLRVLGQGYSTHIRLFLTGDATAVLGSAASIGASCDIGCMQREIPSGRASTYG